jgi:hypothetical protein
VDVSTLEGEDGLLSKCQTVSMMHLAMTAMPLIEKCHQTEEQINSPLHRATMQPPQVIIATPTHHMALNPRVAAHLLTMHIITTTIPHSTMMMPAATTTLLEQEQIVMEPPLLPAYLTINSNAPPAMGMVRETRKRICMRQKTWTHLASQKGLKEPLTWR